MIGVGFKILARTPVPKLPKLPPPPHPDNHRGYKRVYKFKEHYMNRSTFCEIKYMNRLFFSKAGYRIGVGFRILTRTRVPKLPRVPPPPPPEFLKTFSLSVYVNCVQLYSLLQVVLIILNG